MKSFQNFSHYIFGGNVVGHALVTDRAVNRITFLVEGNDLFPGIGQGSVICGKNLLQRPVQEDDDPVLFQGVDVLGPEDGTASGGDDHAGFR